MWIAAVDAGAGDLLSSALVPAAGLGVVIATLVGYLLRQMVVDRRDYREQIVAEQRRTAEVETRVTEERDRADAAQGRVDQELSKRRDAEQLAAVATAELAGQKALVRWYQSEVRRMRVYMPKPDGKFLPDPPDGPDGEVGL